MSPGELRPVTLFDPASHIVDQFDSGKPQLDRWLQDTAQVANAAGTAATWVLCRGDLVVGYYALAMGSVERRASPSRIGRGQPDPVPVLLLARLALDRSEQGVGLGADLLRDALIRAVGGARNFGARAVIVDAIDDEATGFYRRYGFVPLEGPRLYRRISDIERAFEQHHRPTDFG